MVDFNNESTITRAPRNILEILIIEKRTYFLDALESYYKDKSNNRNTNTSVVRARLINLFYEIVPSYLKTANDAKESLDNLKKRVYSSSIEDIQSAFDEINEFLYKKKLLEWDSMKTYDPGSVEEENKFHGLD